ncbi:YfbM family protein [Actinomadura flavalba]|uniref:YfbM family protein n=1 Tax=Actinomadura flavalba TaxID=1120938 RepID=UPI0003770D3B|nr:YfbM family protein [Actinomadura flavalba]
MGLAMSFFRLPPVLEGEADPGAVARLLFGPAGRRAARPADTVLDLGGAWQVLHYLLTGDPWDGPQPASDVVCGGRLLTEDGADELGADVVYLSPDRVKLAADHLTATPFLLLAERWDVRAMAAADVQDARFLDDAARDRVLRPMHDAVTRFFQHAAAEGHAVHKLMTQN